MRRPFRWDKMGHHCLLRDCRGHFVLHGSEVSALPGFCPVHAFGHPQPLYLGHGDMLPAGTFHAHGGEKALHSSCTKAI